MLGPMTASGDNPASIHAWLVDQEFDLIFQVTR